MSRHTPAIVERSAESGFTLETIQLDAVRTDEALVRMEATGICATDLNHEPAFYPAVKGHEGCGIIEEMGTDLQSSAKFKIGERVVLFWNSCEECRYCVADNPNYCELIGKLLFGGRRKDGSVLAYDDHGKEFAAGWFGQSSFSKWSVVHRSCLVKLPDYAATLPSELVASFTCGISTGVGSIANVLKPARATVLAVCGTGNVGLAAIMMAKSIGVESIIAIDINQERLRLAESLGATSAVFLDTEEEKSIKSKIKEASGGRLSAVLDTTGSPHVIRGAFFAMEVGGTLCSVASRTPVAFAPAEIFSTGKTWTGTHQGNAKPATFVPRLIKMHQDGEFPIDRLVKVYTPEQFDQARSDMRSGQTIKGVIKWST